MFDEDESVILARITITRYLDSDDVVDHVSAEATDGTDLGLAEALGMVELAKFTLVDIYTSDEDGE